MAFPTTGILDNFNRSDRVLDGSWTNNFTGDGNANIVGNQITANSGAWGAAYWSASTFGPDMEAYWTINTLPASTDRFNLFVRANGSMTSTPNGYYLRVLGSGSATIQRYTSGNGTALGATFTITGLVNGSSVGLSAVGTTLSAYHKPPGGSWTLVTTRTDVTYTAAGYVAIDFYGTTIRCDDLGGGTVVSGTAVIVTPNSQSLALTKLASSVVSTSVITPNSQSLAMTKLSASVVSTSVITPNNQSLSLAIQGSSVSTSSLTTTNSQSLVLSILPPVISGPVLVNSQSLALGISSPSLVGDSIVAVNSQSLALGISYPSLVWNSVVAVNSQSLSLSSNPVTAQASGVASAGLQSLSLSLNAPSVSCGSSIIPGVGSLAFTNYPAVVITAGATVVQVNKQTIALTLNPVALICDQVVPVTSQSITTTLNPVTVGTGCTAIVGSLGTILAINPVDTLYGNVVAVDSHSVNIAINSVIVGNGLVVDVATQNLSITGHSSNISIASFVNTSALPLIFSQIPAIIITDNAFLVNNQSLSISLFNAVVEALGYCPVRVDHSTVSVVTGNTAHITLNSSEADVTVRPVDIAYI